MSSIQANYTTLPTSLTSVSSASSLSSTSSNSSIPPPINTSGSASISQPGQLFSQLQSLSQSDPAKFKEIAAKLAEEFKDAASKATGNDAKMLTSMANSFSQAADSGKLSLPLAPKAASQGGMPPGQPSGAVQQAFQNALAMLQSMSGTASTAATTA